MYLRMATDTKGVQCPSEVWPCTGGPGAESHIAQQQGFRKKPSLPVFMLWSKDPVQFPVKPFPLNFIKWWIALVDGSNVHNCWASAILMALVSQSLSLPSVNNQFSWARKPHAKIFIWFVASLLHVTMSWTLLVLPALPWPGISTLSCSGQLSNDASAMLTWRWLLSDLKVIFRYFWPQQCYCNFSYSLMSTKHPWCSSALGKP